MIKTITLEYQNEIQEIIILINEDGSEISMLKSVYDEQQANDNKSFPHLP